MQQPRGVRALFCALVATVVLRATPAFAQEPDAGSEPVAPSASPEVDAGEPGAPAASPSESASGTSSSAAPTAAPELSPAPPPTGSAPAPAAPPAVPPASPPPDVRAADPNWHRSDLDDDYMPPPPKTPKSTIDFALGAQVFNPRGKVMTGPVIRIGENLFWVAIEFSPIWLVEDSPDFDGSFLGNQWGFHFELAPLRTPHFELLGGVGLDVYHLWGIHGDEGLLALTLKAHAQYRMTEQASVFATLRGYPLSSSGLELGRDRQGDMIFPILGSLGVEWRWL